MRRLLQSGEVSQGDPGANVLLDLIREDGFDVSLERVGDRYLVTAVGLGETFVVRAGSVEEAVYGLAEVMEWDLGMDLE